MLNHVEILQHGQAVDADIEDALALRVKEKLGKFQSHNVNAGGRRKVVREGVADALGLVKAGRSGVVNRAGGAEGLTGVESLVSVPGRPGRIGECRPARIHPDGRNERRGLGRGMHERGEHIPCDLLSTEIQDRWP